MNFMMGIAALLAFAPTLLLMYVVLRKYTYPAVEQPFFSDPKFFGLFTVGLVEGTILLAVYTYLWTNMIFAILFAIIQCLAMVVVLNLRRFHGKSDTVFYGYGLGLGVGCTMAFGWIFYLGSEIIGNSDTLAVPDYLWLFTMGLANILILSSIGTMVGEGIARLRPMEFAFQGIFVGVLFQIMMVLSYSNSENALLFYGCLIACLVVAAVCFYRTMYMNLSGVVKDVLKMEGKKRNDVPK